MKAQTVFALVALFFLAGRTPAGDVDKAKLRDLAKLPEPDIGFGVGFSTLFGLDFGEKPNPLAEIARLQKQMKGDASDAEHYLRLGRL